MGGQVQDIEHIGNPVCKVIRFDRGKFWGAVGLIEVNIGRDMDMAHVGFDSLAVDFLEYVDIIVVAGSHDISDFVCIHNGRGFPSKELVDDIADGLEVLGSGAQAVDSEFLFDVGHCICTVFKEHSLHCGFGLGCMVCVKHGVSLL